MANQEAWTADPPVRTWLSRLIAPQADARPSTTAFVVGSAAAAAFLASLAMDWQSASIRTQPPVQVTADSENVSTTVKAGLGTVDTLALVYVLGMVAILGLLGAVVNRSDLALRLRMAATGVGVGLLAVMISLVIRLPETVLNSQGMFAAIYGSQIENQVITSHEPGVFLGFVAVILSTVAIWLAARPAARFHLAGAGAGAGAVPVPAAVLQPRSGSPQARDGSTEHEYGSEFQPDPAGIPANGQPSRPGVEVRVYESEPLDLTVTSDGPVVR